MTRQDLLKLRQHVNKNNDRPFIIVGGTAPPQFENAIVLTSEAGLHTLPGKLDRYFRRANITHEAALRAESVKAVSGKPVAYSKPTTPSLLVIGGSSRRFLAIQSILNENGIATTTAFTVPTIRQFLASMDLSGLLVDLADPIANELINDQSAATSIPIFAVINAAEGSRPELESILSKATDVVECEGSLEEIADDLTWKIFGHHAAMPLRPRQSDSPRVHDRLTGLFTREFIEHHLERQMIETESVFLPLSFMTLTASSVGDENAEARRNLPLIAKTVDRLLRQTDVAARLNWTSIGFSLRRTAYIDAARIAARCDIALSDHGFSENIQFSWKICEKRSTHTAKSLIDSTLEARRIRNPIAA
ncbi:MAG: hypothetical protein AAF498_01335 [Pseudomonadota bacterium]